VGKGSGRKWLLVLRWGRPSGRELSRSSSTLGVPSRQWFCHMSRSVDEGSIGGCILVQPERVTLIAGPGAGVALEDLERDVLLP
jgi:hypothetical protein